MKLYKRNLAFALIVLIATPIFAHDMYMWPQYKGKREISLSMLVEKEEVIWFESMTAGLRMDGPTGEANLEVPDEGDPVISFQEEGTYVIGWQSEPIFIQVEPEIFKKYISLEGYTGVADRRKTSRQENRPGREIYTRYIKSFVQIGPQFTDDFNRSFGYKIEIVPLQNPCALPLQSDLDVKVYFDGKPLTNHKIMATYDSYSTIPEDYAQITRTDGEGIARFRITQKGLWLIRTTEMLPLENNGEADWQSFWANFTFEVK